MGVRLGCGLANSRALLATTSPPPIPSLPPRCPPHARTHTHTPCSELVVVAAAVFKLGRGWLSGSWIANLKFSITRSLFLTHTPPTHTHLHNVQRSQQSSSRSPLMPASFTYFFLLQFMSWYSFSVCVFYFVWIFFNLTFLELAVLPFFSPTLHPHSLSTHLL